MARNLKVGERVTVKAPVEASYSRYGKQPECWFTPGMVGTVIAVNIPVVFWRGKGCPQSFCVVEFDGSQYGAETASRWTVRPYARDLVRVNRLPKRV